MSELGDWIELTKGEKARISAIDSDLKCFKWRVVTANPGKLYAGRSDSRVNGRGTLLLHREIAKRAGLQILNMEVDHRNGDGLDCRRENLRAATHRQNTRNSALSSANTSGAKGVTWHKAAGKWAAQIAVDGRHIHLGLFASIDEAAAAYGQAATQFFGDFARTAIVNRIEFRKLAPHG